MIEVGNSQILRKIPLLLIVVLFCPFAYSRVIYVNDDGIGANDGSSWIDAYSCLQDALVVARGGDEIRVAQGIYKPDQRLIITARGGPEVISSGDRTATFQLINGVAIKGGYIGFGESKPDARDVDLYRTILSGDLNGDDGRNFANNSENSYHMVTGSGCNETAILDGFTITGGNANGSDTLDCGGGMYNSYGNPKVANCTLTRNFASEIGGGDSLP